MPSGPDTRANGERTKAKILDAAEVLFGARGFDGVSLRDITVGAQVTLALSSYHFKTKEKLFEAVVARRADVLCKLRRERLVNLGEGSSVREILDAFMGPLFQQIQSGESGWSSYVRILARLGEDDRWLHLLGKNFDDVAREFLDALATACQNVSRESLARRFVMSLQLMLAAVARHRRIDQLTGGAVRADDLPQVYADLLAFATAGFLAPQNSK